VRRRTAARLPQRRGSQQPARMQQVMRRLLERSSVCATVPISLFASYRAFADADRLVCWRQS
jgi:hypothetical protein